MERIDTLLGEIIQSCMYLTQITLGRTLPKKKKSSSSGSKFWFSITSHSWLMKVASTEVMADADVAIHHKWKWNSGEKKIRWKKRRKGQPNSKKEKWITDEISKSRNIFKICKKKINWVNYLQCVEFYCPIPLTTTTTNHSNNKMNFRISQILPWKMFANVLRK